MWTGCQIQLLKILACARMTNRIEGSKCRIPLSPTAPEFAQDDTITDF